MLGNFLLSALRVSSPLVFAALGGMFSERAGVINIALEGLMLMGAFAGAATTLWTHSPWLGSAGAMATGALFAGCYGLFVIRWRANQIVAGTAINLLALGLTPVLCKVFYGVTGSSPAIPLAERFGSAPLWLCGAAVVVAWAAMTYTRGGLWLGFAGEHPAAARAAGIDVKRVRWTALLLSGALAGMGGACLSLFLSSSFSRNMTAGRGFMALAALIFGKWRPVPAALACLLFGSAEALQMRLQGASFPGGTPVPVQLIQILPYLVTVLVLAGFLGRSRPPAALGKTLH